MSTSKCYLHQVLLYCLLAKQGHNKLYGSTVSTYFLHSLVPNMHTHTTIDVACLTDHGRYAHVVELWDWCNDCVKNILPATNALRGSHLLWSHAFSSLYMLSMRLANLQWVICFT